MTKKNTEELLNVGDNAPDFTAEDEAGNTHSLKDYRGQKVILYFYPKDNTPGCTQQAKDFTADYKKFAKHNTVILGVSRDNVRSHNRFKDKYDINFPLLVDDEEKLCQLYDTIKQKNMFGKKVRGIQRSTFLIDENGKIQQIWRKVNVPGHVQEVLEIVKEK